MEERIGLGSRLGAAIIDAVCVYSLGVILGGILGGAFGAGAGALATEGAAEGAAGGGILGAILGAAFGILVLGLVWIVWEGITGAALGKRLLKIRIKSEDGSPGNLDKLIARAAIKNIAVLCGFAAAMLGIGLIANLGNLAAFAIFVGCFFVLGDKRQAFHDMLTKTAVYPN
jgi:uncharacterized RDD family membrane protein YckC